MQAGIQGYCSTEPSAREQPGAKPQAEVLAEPHVELMEITLATKQDLKDLRAELTSKIDNAIIKIIGTITAVMVGVAAIMAFLKF